MRRKGSKSKSQRKHAFRRFTSRFDDELKREDYENAINSIKTGKAEFFDRQSNRVTRWKVEIHGIPIIAVYDTSRGTIVTFITEDMAETSAVVREAIKSYRSLK